MTNTQRLIDAVETLVTRHNTGHMFVSAENVKAFKVVEKALAALKAEPQPAEVFLTVKSGTHHCNYTALHDVNGEMVPIDLETGTYRTVLYPAKEGE